MRPLISLLSLTLLAPSALADDTPAAPAPTPPSPAKPDDGAKAPDAKAADAEAPAPAPAPSPPTTFSAIDRSALPASCADHARFAQAMVRPIAAASRLSLAQCLIGPSLAPIKSVLDTHESMQTLERAVGQSIVLFDEVIALGDPGMQVLAAHAKGQLYEDLLGRMAQAVPPPAGGEAAASLYQSRKSLLELMLQPWRDEGIEAFEQAVAIAKANPRIGARNPAVRDVVARSEQRVQSAITAKAQVAAPPPAPATEPSKLPPGATAAPAETAPMPPPPPPKDKPKDGASAPSASSTAPSSPAPR